MNYYGGLDVSLEETAICVVDGLGLIVKELRAASEPEALIAALKAIDVPLERIGLEACSLTAWLHDGLRGAQAPVLQLRCGLGAPMGSFEAYVLIVSSTMALFWLGVRSETNRSLSPNDDRREQR